MRYLAILIALMLVGCDEQTRSQPTRVFNPTYQELVDYPASCDLADSQLAELKGLQTRKNFNDDPDLMNEQDRAYNGILKSTIWWFAYKCDKS